MGRDIADYRWHYTRFMVKIKKKDTWIIIPAYREGKRIADVVKRVKKQGFSNVVVVDDGSPDKTREKAEAAGAIVLRHIINMHKGASMLTGSVFALKNGAKALVFVDGDGQHAPEEIPLFLKELNAGHDIVFGARRESKKMPFQRRLGKLLVRNAVRILYDISLHDVLCGYRAMTQKGFQKVKWTSRDYNVECEMVAMAGKKNLKYKEITISTIYHNKYKGVTMLHGFGFLWKLLWWKVAK